MDGLRNHEGRRGVRRRCRPLREPVEKVRGPHKVEVESRRGVLETVEDVVEGGVERDVEVRRVDERVDGRVETPPLVPSPDQSCGTDPVGPVAPYPLRLRVSGVRAAETPEEAWVGSDSRSRFSPPFFDPGTSV